MKTLFLSPPSFDGFDGGAGSRYQARREVTSFWYPTWLAQPAALVPNAKLLEKALRNPQGLRFEEARKLAQALDFGSTALAAAIIFSTERASRNW